MFGRWLCGCARVWWWSCGCGGLTPRWQQGLAQRWPFGGLCWLRTTDGCKPVARPRRLLPRSVARSSQSLPLAAHLLRGGGGGAKSRLVGTDGACRQLRRLRTSQGVVPWCRGCWHLGCGRSTRTRQSKGYYLAFSLSNGYYLASSSSHKASQQQRCELNVFCEI